MPDSSLVVAVLEHDDLPFTQTFSCGDADLDEFLQDDAWRRQQEHVATTYVVFSSDGANLLGYAAILADLLAPTSPSQDPPEFPQTDGV